MIIRMIWGGLVLACLCLILLYWATRKPVYLQACRLLFKLVLGMSLLMMVLFFIGRMMRI